MDARIVIDPAVQHGQPVIRGTRVPIVRVIGGIAGGMSVSEVATEYGVTDEDVRATLDYATGLIAEESRRLLP